MKTTNIREAIRDYISEADDRFVQMVYAMMKVNQEEETLTEKEEEELKRRIARHESGESRSYSWPEARARIEKPG
jgi:hypothetical protein